MFKKYFRWLVAIVITGTMCFIIISSLFFTHAIKKIKKVSEENMIAAVEYTREYLDVLFFSSPKQIDHTEVDHWLADFIDAANLERMVITDTVPNVLWSSHEFIVHGESYIPYIIDEAVFSRVVREKKYHFSPIVTISGILFQSLYYPCEINGIPCIITVESDQNILRDTSRLRLILFLFLFLFIAITALMLTMIYVVDKKLQHAYTRAAHHQRLAFLGKTSAELAHELKNPLGIIKTGLDALRIRYDPSQQERSFTFVSQEIMRLSSLIDNILSFSRSKKVKKELFNPLPILQERIDSINQIYQLLHISCSLPDSIKLCGDPHAFGRIADNLLRNAAEATEGKGTVTISGYSKEKKYRISFRDNGSGIEKAKAEKIFEPFETGSKTGTGLGLAIVKTLCDSMQWDIVLESSNKGETTFALIIQEDMWEKS